MMDEEPKKINIVSNNDEDVTLYSLFSNPVRDVFLFIILFLISYYLFLIFTIVPIDPPQYIIDANNNTVEPLTIDISDLENNRFKKVLWHGLPIGIYKRTKVDFENLKKKHLKQINPADNAKIRKDLEKYLLGDNTKHIDDKFRSIRDEYFVFVMLSPFKACKLIVQFFHDGRDKNKDQFAKIFSTCTHQIYHMNGKLSIESYFNNQYVDKVYSNYLLIPNHRYIDDKTIELFPNE